MAGLKPTYGGSTPPFLVSLIGLVRMPVLRMCGKEEGSRVVILHWLQLVQLTLLHVWQRMLLK